MSSMGNRNFGQSIVVIVHQNFYLIPLDLFAAMNKELVFTRKVGWDYSILK